MFFIHFLRAPPKGILATFRNSNTADYTLNLTAPNYTLSDLTLNSNQPWLTITKTTNPTAQTQIVTATGAPDKDWSVSVPPIWLTVSKSANNLTIQPINNGGAESTTTLTLTYDGTTLKKSISQTSGYSFSLTSNDATIENGNRLLAYSIPKTYTVAITALEPFEFSVRCLPE